MSNFLYRYQLVRFVADVRRVEPQNIGVIVQSDSEIRSRFNVHFRGKQGFDFKNYRDWRAFFNDEIVAPAVPLFQPDKKSIEFLFYLQSKCRGNYIMSDPAEIVMTTDDTESVLIYLYETLVKPVPEKEKLDVQPVKRFRNLISELGTEQKFLKRNKPIYLPGEKSELVQYQYDRNHGSDTKVIVQAVQWFPNDPQRTKGTIENAIRVAEVVDKSKIRAELSVVADNIVKPKNDENPASNWLFDYYSKAMEEMRQNTTQIIRDSNEVAELVSSMQHDLKELEFFEAAKQKSGDLLAAK